MEPTPLNNQEQPQSQPQPQTPPPAETPSAPVNQLTRPPMTIPTSKKSQKKLYIIIGIVVVVIIVAVIGYLVLINKKPAVTPADNGKNGTTTASNTTDNSTVGLITSVLTSNASGETKVTNTDESNLSSDANNVAGSLGDSVNENNIK